MLDLGKKKNGLFGYEFSNNYKLLVFGWILIRNILN